MSDLRRLPSGDALRFDLIESVMFSGAVATVALTPNGSVPIENAEDIAALRAWADGLPGVVGEAPFDHAAWIRSLKAGDDILVLDGTVWRKARVTRTDSSGCPVEADSGIGPSWWNAERLWPYGSKPSTAEVDRRTLDCFTHCRVGDEVEHLEYDHVTWERYVVVAPTERHRWRIAIARPGQTTPALWSSLNANNIRWPLPADPTAELRATANHSKGSPELSSWHRGVLMQSSWGGVEVARMFDELRATISASVAEMAERHAHLHEIMREARADRDAKDAEIARRDAILADLKREHAHEIDSQDKTITNLRKNLDGSRKAIEGRDAVIANYRADLDTYKTVTEALRAELAGEKRANERLNHISSAWAPEMIDSIIQALGVEKVGPYWTDELPAILAAIDRLKSEAHRPDHEAAMQDATGLRAFFDEITVMLSAGRRPATQTQIRDAIVALKASADAAGNLKAEVAALKAPRLTLPAEVAERISLPWRVSGQYGDEVSDAGGSKVLSVNSAGATKDDAAMATFIVSAVNATVKP